MKNDKEFSIARFRPPKKWDATALAIVPEDKTVAAFAKEIIEDDRLVGLDLEIARDEEGKVRHYTFGVMALGVTPVLAPGNVWNDPSSFPNWTARLEELKNQYGHLQVLAIRFNRTHLLERLARAALEPDA